MNFTLDFALITGYSTTPLEFAPTVHYLCLDCRSIPRPQHNRSQPSVPILSLQMRPLVPKEPVSGLGSQKSGFLQSIRYPLFQGFYSTSSGINPFRHYRPSL